MVNAKMALLVLELRGGDATLVYFFGLYRLVYLIEKYLLRKIIHPLLMKYLSKYIAFKKKHKYLQYPEDATIAIISALMVGRSLASMESGFTYNIDLPEDKANFEEFMLDQGVGNTQCDGFLNVIYYTFKNGALTDEEKIKQFSIFIDFVLKSDNTGDKQALILCLIATSYLVMMKTLLTKIS